MRCLPLLRLKSRKSSKSTTCSAKNTSTSRCRPGARGACSRSRWSGSAFPMIITGAMTGSVLVLGMGFQRALIAMIIGNLIMFAYVGALGLLGTKKGMNFALHRQHRVRPQGLLFSLRACCRRCCSAGMRCRPASPAISSARPIDLNYVLMTVIAGLLYIGITFVGVRGPALYRPRLGAALRHPRRLGRGRRRVDHHGWAAIMPTPAPTARRPCPWASD